MLGLRFARRRSDPVLADAAAAAHAKLAAVRQRLGHPSSMAWMRG